MKRPPFAMGSVVYVNQGAFKGTNIIHKADLSIDPDEGTYSIKYSSNRGAWIRHEDCSLVAPPSKASLKKLVESILEERE